MIQAKSVWKLLKDKGYDFFSGVPCSILTELLDAAFKDHEIKYVPAVRENVALGIASGAYLAGRKGGILMQNSGLGNIINALTSFNLIYKIPVLMFISWRGCEGKDAPEHIIMGNKMIELLDTLSIPHIILSENFEEDLNWAISQINEKSIPAAVIIKKDLIS